MYVDRNEFRGCKTVVHTTTPGNIDLVFAEAGLVIGVEAKLPEDLYQSIRSRRLARQVRTLRELCDVWVVMVRGLWPDALEVPQLDGRGRPIRRLSNRGTPVTLTKAKNIWDCVDLWAELARLQALGVYVLHGPPAARDSDLTEWVERLRPILSGEKVTQALAGTDKRAPTERRPGWLLRRIPGIGDKRSQALQKEAGSTFEVLRNPNLWTTPAIAAHIEEALR